MNRADNRCEIRDLDDARDFLTQGLWLQRAMQPAAATVQHALTWSLEITSQGAPLPPPGFIADLGHVAFGLDWETKGSRQTIPIPNVASELLTAYEDQVLGKIYSDWAFSTASEALRRYREGRDQHRGFAFVINQLRERAGFAGADFSPGIITALLGESPDDVLRQGYESLQRNGPNAHLIALYDSLKKGVRLLAEVLGPEDILELQSGTALDAEADRLAFRQVAEAAAILDRSLPRHRVRPLPRRQEVPTRVLDEDTYPVGGFSSISNRGSVESLLHSQLAYIDEEEQPDLFDIKYLRDELLFYSRDENQFLRRRRTFVLVFYPELAASIRFKDSRLPYQRQVLLLALLFVAVRKLSEWLSIDALVFDFVFVVPDGQPRVFPLATEYELLCRLMREQAANGTVAFDFLFLSSAGSGAEREQAGVEELKKALRDKLPQGTIRFATVPSLEAVEDLCSQRARRSLCHCLAMMTGPRDLSPQDTAVTQLIVDGPSPSIGAGFEAASIPEGDGPMDHWCSALHQILRRWL